MLNLQYDRQADILYISTRPPYQGQASEEIGDEVLTRLNPDTGEVENLELLFFSTRLQAGRPIELPIQVDLRLVKGL